VLKSEINARNKFVRMIEGRSDEMPDENDLSNGLYARYKGELRVLEAYREHCLARESPASQVVGTVAYSRALCVRDEFRVDWALVNCEPDTYGSTGTATSPYNNSCHIFNLGSLEVRDELLAKVCPAFTVTFDGFTELRSSQLKLLMRFSAPPPLFFFNLSMFISCPSL
jgi:hypothetical protein